MAHKRTYQEFDGTEYPSNPPFPLKRPRHDDSLLVREFCSMPESNGLYRHHNYDLRHHRKPQPTSLGYYRSAAGYNYSSNKTSKAGGDDIRRNAHSFSLNGHRGSSNASLSLALHKRKLEKWRDGGRELERKRHHAQVGHDECVSVHSVDHAGLGWCG